MAIMAYPQIKRALSGDTSRPRAYYGVPLEPRINYAVMDLGLAAFVAIMSDELHESICR
jgi:hypothetical protein